MLVYIIATTRRLGSADNLLAGLTTYLYGGYNPFTKYHGHPSREDSVCSSWLICNLRPQGILAALGTAAVSSGGFLLLLVTWQISIL